MKARSTARDAVLEFSIAVASAAGIVVLALAVEGDGLAAIEAFGGPAIALLGVAVGAFSFLLYQASGRVQLLSVGAAVAIAGLLDAFEVATTGWVPVDGSSDLSWRAWGVVFPLFLAHGLIRGGAGEGSADRGAARRLLVLVAAVVGLVVIRGLIGPTETVVVHPGELLPIGLAVAALWWYLRESEWRSDDLDLGIALALVFAVGRAGAMMLVDSGDSELLVAAHLLTGAAYVSVGLGLQFRSIQVFRAERAFTEQLRVAEREKDHLIAELQRVNNELLTFKESLPIGLYWLDDAGYVTYANSVMHRLLGCGDGELVGRHFMTFSPDGVEALRHEFRATLFSEGQVHLGEQEPFYIRRLDGEETPTLFGAAVAEHLGVIGYAIDITPRVTLMDQLRMQTKVLEHANTQMEVSLQDLDVFTRAVAHDLSGPLRQIDHLAKWVREDAGEALTGESSRFLDEIRDRVVGMESLLEDLLSYSRAGRVHAPSEWFDLAAVVQGEWTIVGADSFDLHFTPEVAEVFTPRMPCAFVVRNLLDNAVHHHHRDRGNVWVELADEGSEFRITVRDDGPGIARQFHDRIFEMFQTLEAPKDPRHSGLGLTISKKFATVYGGSLGVESTKGEGASFHFTWPKTWVQTEGMPITSSPDRTG